VGSASRLTEQPEVWMAGWRAVATWVICHKIGLFPVRSVIQKGLTFLNYQLDATALGGKQFADPIIALLKERKQNIYSYSSRKILLCVMWFVYL